MPEDFDFMKQMDKIICFPCVIGKEHCVRYACIQTDGSMVYAYRRFVSDRYSQFIESCPINPFYGEKLEWPDRAKWIEQFFFCAGCGSISHEQTKGTSEAIERINKLKLIKGHGKLDGTYLADSEFLDWFNGAYDKASGKTFKIEPFCNVFGRRCNVYDEDGNNDCVFVRFSEYAANNKMDCYDQYLREFHPAAWDFRDLEDHPDAKRIRELRKIEQYALERSQSLLIAEFKKSRASALDAIRRNKKKLNKKHLIAISRIGMASKLNQICKH